MVFAMCHTLSAVLVLGEGLAPPEAFRPRGLQPRAIAALPTQLVFSQWSLVFSQKLLTNSLRLVANLSRLSDSNRRPAVYKTAALPLS